MRMSQLQTMGMHDTEENIICCYCGQTFDKGGVYFGLINIAVCSKCVASRNQPDMYPFAYALAGAYLDAPQSKYTSPLEYVSDILQRLEKDLYYCIAQDRFMAEKESNNGNEKRIVGM